MKREVSMVDRAVNRKRIVRRRSMVLVGLMVLLVLPAAAEQKSKFVIGVYGGWSLGLGYEFRWHSSGHYSDGYSLNSHLGAYVQHDISELLGVQLNLNFQGISYHWMFHDFGRPSEEGSEWNPSISFSMNGILTYARSKNLRLYILGGAGIFSGKLSIGHTFMDFSGGTGIKIYLPPNSRSAINFAGVFHHLPVPAGEFRSARHANFLRFQIGYEFSLGDKKD